MKPLPDTMGRPLRELRLSVLDRCNLRCTYCMPEEGIEQVPHADILSLEEIRDVTKVAVGMGINKVRLTGGEPLVRHGILDLVKMLAGIDGIDDFAMTTNGILLDRFAGPLREAGLHRLNVSLDTLDPDRFRETTRCGELSEVLKGLEAARAAEVPPDLWEELQAEGLMRADAPT